VLSAVSISKCLACASEQTAFVHICGGCYRAATVIGLQTLEVQYTEYTGIMHSSGQSAGEREKVEEESGGSEICASHPFADGQGSHHAILFLQ
jgi:hypothetical protein